VQANASPSFSAIHHSSFILSLQADNQSVPQIISARRTVGTMKFALRIFGRLLILQSFSFSRFISAVVEIGYLSSFFLYCYGAVLQAPLRVFPVRLSVRLSKSKTKKCRKIKIATREWIANFQPERSKVKVTGRKNHQNLAAAPAYQARQAATAH